jgi:hypothetical protein
MECSWCGSWWWTGDVKTQHCRLAGQHKPDSCGIPEPPGNTSDEGCPAPAVLANNFPMSSQTLPPTQPISRKSCIGQEIRRLLLYTAEPVEPAELLQAPLAAV